MKECIMQKYGSFVVALLVAAVLVASVAPLFAGGLFPNDPNQYRGAPGPLLGAGLPILALAAGGYLLLRRVRGKVD